MTYKMVLYVKVWKFRQQSTGTINAFFKLFSYFFAELTKVVCSVEFIQEHPHSMYSRVQTHH